MATIYTKIYSIDTIDIYVAGIPAKDATIIYNLNRKPVVNIATPVVNFFNQVIKFLHHNLCFLKRTHMHGFN